MKSNSGGGNSAIRNVCIGYRAGTLLRTGSDNVVIGHGASISATNAVNQIAIGKEVIGVADNSVTLGNANVTDVYMAQDSGATVHCAGVNFPDTQVASADANTLDDYEEGTFTPTWVSGSGTLGSINYSNRVGKYTKIGNAVTITISFYNGSFDAGTGSGSLKITGLPFTSGAKSSLALGDTRLFGGDNPSEAEVTNSSTNVTLYFRTASNGANSELQVSDAGTGSGALNLVTLSGTYFV